MGEGSQDSGKLSYKHLNQQGLDLFKAGAIEKAEVLLKESLETFPDQPDIIAKRIECLIHLGHLSEGELLTREQLQLNPLNETLLNYLGHLLMLQQKVPEAAKVFTQSTIQENSQPLSFYNLATAELELKNWDAAKQALEKVLKFAPQHVDAIRGMGLVHLGKNQPAKAKDFLLKATKLNPHDSESWYDLGNVNMDLDLWKDAKVAFQNCLKENPQHLKGAINLAQVLIHLDSFEEAKSLVNTLLKISPNEWRNWFNLGQLYYKTGHFSQAIQSFEKALCIEPNHWEIYNALGISWHETRDFQTAQKILQKAIEINPNAADAHWNYALTTLSLGNFSKGWESYEWRWKRKSFPTKSPQTGCKKWGGEKGRLCLYTEQGYGDNIQFYRFIKEAKSQCQNQVILFADEALCELFSSGKEVEVRPKKENWENELANFDYHLPLLSLPKVLGQHPSVYGKKIPYIYIRESSIKEWEDHFEEIACNKMKVGLAWQGNPNNKPGLKRSIPEEIFLKWLDCLPSNFTYFSLQPEDSGLIKNTPSGRVIHTFQKKPKNFAETAAFVEHMDFVISVDTAIAHLTGAIGKQLYLLLYKTPDWRWINGDKKDLWYPGAQILRQSVAADWLSPLSELKYTLSSMNSENKERTSI